MADREQSPAANRGSVPIDKKQPRDTAGKEREATVKSGGTVGRDVPEHSTAKDTETAVEAGHKGGEHSDDKH